MKLSVRYAGLTALAALLVTACAPQTSTNSSSDKDEKTGTLRVWLFQEVGNTPKEKAVDSVVAAFEKAHKGTEVDVEYIPSTPAPSASRPPSTTPPPLPT